MKRLLIPLLLFCLSAKSQELLIKNITIVDVRTGALMKNADLLIQKNKIAVIGKDLKAGKNTIIIDGRNKYLVPGFWDMHAHALSRWERTAALYLANGITGVRDMANRLSLAETHNLLQNVLNGKAVGPRFITGARLLDGPQSRFPNVAILIPTKEYAAKVADSLKQEGVNFYKVYETLPREAFYTFIEKGKEYHMPVVGHVPVAIQLDEAIKAGMKSIEHIKYVATSEMPEQMKDSMRGIFRAAMWDLSNKDTIAAIQKNETGSRIAIKYFNQNDAIEKGKLLAEYHTWLTPTMVQSTRGYYEKQELLRNKTWDYMPASITAGWRRRVENDIRIMRFDIPEYVELEQKTVQGFYKAGVKFLAGTDANDAFIGNIPGFSVHEEMKLFVKAGLSNLEALQTATLNPAIFMEADSLGTIEVNKIADLVLLDANPLENISNTTKIHAVIFNGRFFDRKKLDEMLEQVRLLVKTQ